VNAVRCVALRCGRLAGNALSQSGDVCAGRCTWPVYRSCTRLCTRVACTYTASKGRARAVYMAVFTTRTRPCNGRVHGPFRRRPWTRSVYTDACTCIHGPYTKSTEFATFSNSCDYIRKQGKALLVTESLLNME